MVRTKGIQVYEILPDGCLNGTYANEGTSNEIYNEISRKKSESNLELTDPLIGYYDCVYFDIGNKHYECDLEITKGSISKYYFIWSEKGPTKPIFEGHGWQTNQNTITIKYWSV